MTATQAIYNLYRSYNVDTTAVVYDIDINCDPSCSRLGPFAMFNEQMTFLRAFTSDGRGSYHAMQWTVRKRFGNDVRFDFNYTLSKSLDLNSNAARTGGNVLGVLRCREMNGWWDHWYLPHQHPAPWRPAKRARTRDPATPEPALAVAGA